MEKGKVNEFELKVNWEEGKVNEFELEVNWEEGKVNEFELKVNWEEGKLMMNTLNFWVLVKVFKVDKP